MTAKLHGRVHSSQVYNTHMSALRKKAKKKEQGDSGHRLYFIHQVVSH